MKRIGIITYHNAVNYGAALQAYALQNYIKKNIDYVETIDYRCPAIDIQYRIKSIKHSYSLLNFFAHNITCFFRIKKKKRFKNFIKNYLVLSSAFTPKNIKTCDCYDVLITGSDQVFNPKCNGGDLAYFLNFGDGAKKYSYAASLGSPEQFSTSKKDCFSLLREMECVSLREQSAVDYLKNKIESNVALHVDPVWLLDENEWVSLLKLRTTKPYILVYNLMDYKKTRRFVKRIAKEKKMPIISINRTIMGDMMFFGISKIKSNVSPLDFLKLIKGSSYFFTDSFHGTSFAIILEKQFGVFLNDKKNNTNSRLVDLLSFIDLRNRIVENDSFNADEHINFAEAKALIKPLIGTSKKYIDSIVKKNTEGST